MIKKFIKSSGLLPLALKINRMLNKSESTKFNDDAQFYSNFIKPNDLVFDVGANAGLKTEIFLSLGAKVIAFEPQPDCVIQLKQRNANSKKLKVISCALGSEKTSSTFFIRKLRGTSGFIQNWEESPEKTISVNIETLDEMVKEHGKPMFCKIDVEGYEINVLKGLTTSIKCISFEYHINNTENIAKAIECLDYLSTLGNISINITPAEKTEFLFKNWQNKQDFLNFFNNELGKIKNFIYGDIFVHID